MKNAGPGRAKPRALDEARVSRMFPTYVGTYFWPECPKQNPELKRRILEAVDSKKGVRVSNRGGWHSNYDFSHWSGPAGSSLKKFASAAADHATNTVMQDQGRYQWKVDMWANVNAQGDFNLAHNHPASTWSAVYYVDVGEEVEDRPESGLLVLHNPCGQVKMSFLDAPDLNPTQSIKPQRGMLVMFPSYLVHSVNPNLGTQSRISIAINLAKVPYP